jgi:WhiB family redox-sensing transcriptional regulator
MNWRDRAACKGHDSSAFFDDETPRPALAICRRCPVTRECLSAALDNAEPAGIWGGLTSTQRARIPKGARSIVSEMKPAQRFHTMPERAANIARDAIAHGIEPVGAIVLRLCLGCRADALLLLEHAERDGLDVPEIARAH